MPTYEYLCTSCGNEFEEMQKISEPALEVCPKCGKHTAKRQISAGNFILKGGGWYADLYSSSKPSGKKEATKDESGSSGSTESAKPAEGAKTETKSEAPAAKAPSAAPPASTSTGSSSKE
jgi:putative FmdB family regulatory protein